MEICGLKEAVETLENKVFNYRLNKEMGIVDKMTEQGRKEGEALETILAELEKKDLKISALQMEREYDVKMIDEVKGEAVKLYKELGKKNILIDTMQAEFERLEDLEDNTDMLKMELEKKNKIIDLMAKWLYEDDTSFGYGKLKEVNTQEKIKEYFIRKVEE